VFYFQASGVKVDNTVIEKFHEFKIKKNTGYLVLGFSEDISKIVVLKEGVNKVPQNAPHNEKSILERKKKFDFRKIFK
jgi:hypothetical protein